MPSNNSFFLVLVFLFASGFVKGQKVYKILEKYEEAVFSIITYGETDSKNDTASGFFINPNGIAIVPAHIFSTNDSGVITLRNNKAYSVTQIISTHKMADLCLIKIDNPQDKTFEYIIPSLKTNSSQSEVLILCHPNDGEGGLSFGEVEKVYQAPYLDRLVKITAPLSTISSGSPVINNSGDLIGISYGVGVNAQSHYLSTHIVNDSLWQKHDPNLPHIQYRQAAKSSEIMNNAVLRFLNEEWVEAAKGFSKILKVDSLNTKALVFRSEARRMYNNKFGRDLDIESLKNCSGNTFLVDYFNAKNNLLLNKKNDAFVDLIACLEKHENYAPALVEFGLLVLNLRNDLETAEKCFNTATAASPLYANGYYERGRFIFQYFKYNDRALEDINKAITLNKFLPGIYSIRGTLKVDTENYMGAIADFDAALEINPNDTYALFNRGVAFYNIGMKKKCCSDWLHAEKLGHYKATKYISKYCKDVVIESTFLQ